MGTVVKFPDEGRIVRFGRADAEQSATVIILPVVRIERHGDPRSPKSRARATIRPRTMVAAGA